MKRRLYRAKSRGQSIPLLAIMLVVLFGFAALSLDAGNMYAQQRSVVRATNVAAIEGMNRLIDHDSDENVHAQILTSLRSNGVNAVDGPAQVNQMTVEAQYLDAAGQAFLNCPVGDCDAATFDSIRSQITYIRVLTGGQVETYFARVVGQNELNVRAVAHATKGVCVEGVYPISVDAATLDLNTQKFTPPDTIYSDELYRNPPRTQKRLFLREAGLSGNFGYMRWRGDDPSDGSATVLAEALTDSGSLSDGFVEADWPYDNQGNTVVPIEEPGGYPLVPTKLSAGDWIGGSSGLSNSGPVRDQLDIHIRNRTIVTLPIYDYAVGNGANAAYHLLDLGKFYIRGYGKINPNTPESEQYGGQSGWYIDLVYLGRGGECAFLNTGPAGVDLMAMEGQISFYPHYAAYSEPTDAPIQYVIVLDVSGSMSWNFAGQGTNSGGNVVQCQGSGAVQCPAVSPFPDTDQRRIKIARDLLQEFVTGPNGVRLQDQVRIVTFSGTFGLYPDPNPPSNTEALDALSRVYPTGWTSDKPTLSAAIDDAASMGGSYVTSGETPSAVGLARALDLYENTNSRDPVTNKQYKRAVIFLTDGVANVTRNGLLNSSPSCGSEDVECQDGEFPSDPGTLKPIPAMNNEAFNLDALISGEANGNGGIYVIALGPTSLDALQRVSDFVVRADSPTALEDALNAIRNQVTFGTCTDGVIRTSPTERIEGVALPDYSLPALSGRISSPEIGVVTLTGSGGQIYSGKILWDAGSGTMFYRILNIPPGQYTLSYWMAYKSPDDGITRIYDHALPISGGSLTSESQSISLEPNAETLGARNQPIILDLDPDLNVCQTT